MKKQHFNIPQLGAIEEVIYESAEMKVLTTLELKLMFLLMNIVSDFVWYCIMYSSN